MLAACQQNKSIIGVFYLNSGAANRVYRDVITFYMTILKMRKTELPKIHWINAETNEGIQICERYKIDKFPTTIVFSSNADPQCTLIGASFLEIDGIIEVQKSLSKNRSKAITIVICIINLEL